MDYTYIDTPEGLRQVVERLRDLPLIAADTEAAGYHRYFDRLSLVQLSSRDEHWLVDPLAIDDLGPLAELFEDPAIETIFHDADYDLRILDRDAGLRLVNLFDTQTAAAFLGERSLGLGNVVEKYLGIKLAKEYQRADWAERPLTEGMKQYATTDTAHLPDLRDKLREALEAKGRMHWAEEEFRRRELTRWAEQEDGREAFLKVKGARDLAPRGLAILRELYEWREKVARERDQATFRVLGNQALLEMSAAPPQSEADLPRVTGISEGLAQRRGRDIMAAVRRGLEVPDGELPRFPPAKRWDRDPELEARTEALKHARNVRAEEIDMDAGFVMSRALLEEVARARPATREALEKVPGVRRWQVEAIGDALLKVLAKK
ncbi:MAG TPA: ribonuclease D [Longimicrobiaceae bacterium]|jgi:ribonuclease D|nr:ribonuclease D [Longimicrobiaceae bacterium]